MPQTFSKFGISFLYPDNWLLDEQEGETQSATVYSPGGAFWSVSVHPASADPIGLVDAAAGAMEAEYQELEREPHYGLVDGRKVHGADLGFYYLDLTNSAFVRSFRTPVATYVIFYQAEDREFRESEQVFAAITKSFFDCLD